MSQSLHVLASRTYEQSFARLASADQYRVLCALHKVCALTTHHPSFHVHRLQIRPALWEAYITRRNLRLLFDQPTPGLLRLWNVGGHPILEWARRAPVDPIFAPLVLPAICAEARR